MLSQLLDECQRVADAASRESVDAPDIDATQLAAAGSFSQPGQLRAFQRASARLIGVDARQLVTPCVRNSRDARALECVVLGTTRHADIPDGDSHATMVAYRMRFIVLYPKHDTPGTGDSRRVFRPGAEAFARFWAGSEVLAFDNRLPAPERRQSINEDVTRIKASGSVEGLSYFGHGTKRALPSAGYTTATIGGLLDAGLDRAGPAPAALYNACTTGAGIGADGGLADVTRDHLCAIGGTRCRVHGHTGRGHASENPRAVFVDGEGSPVGCAGGRWVVQPRARPLWAEHAHALDVHPTYRYWFPLQSVPVILAWLVLPRDQRPELVAAPTWGG